MLVPESKIEQPYHFTKCNMHVYQLLHHFYMVLYTINLGHLWTNPVEISPAAVTIFSIKVQVSPKEWERPLVFMRRLCPQVIRALQQHNSHGWWCQIVFMFHPTSDS